MTNIISANSNIQQSPEDKSNSNEIQRPIEASPASNPNGSIESTSIWEEEVCGEHLLDEIANCIKTYTVLDQEQVTAVTLWVVFTWLHDQSTVSPILNISSPEKRCGKSTLLTIVQKLSSNPLMASNITPAALYRSIEKWKPTLMVDEADTFLANSADLRGILNAGHYKDTACVIRCTGDNNEPTNFPTWCPKVIAGIGELPETILDRSIVIGMKRKLLSQRVAKIRRAPKGEFDVLTSKIGRWTQDNATEYESLALEEVEGIDDRAQDNWEPLLCIAELAGQKWKELSILSLRYMEKDNDDISSVGEELIQSIVRLFNFSQQEVLPTREIINGLISNEEEQWATYSYGKPINAIQLSKLLKPFNIKPKAFRVNSFTFKGYHLNSFQEARERYIGNGSDEIVHQINPVTSVTPVTFTESNFFFN